MSSFSFGERQSRAIRLWHWLTVIAVGLLLLTIFVSKTYLNGQHTGQTIHDTLAKLGIQLTRDQVNQTVGALRESIWTSHIYFGYGLTALFAFRLVIEIVQGKLVKSVRSGFSFLKIKEERKNVVHYMIVKAIYIVFYGILATIVGTGLWMTYYRDGNLVSREQFHDIKEIHETCFNLMLVFIFLHIVGIIRAERGKHKNIVSGMIHGEKTTVLEEMV